MKPLSSSCFTQCRSQQASGLIPARMYLRLKYVAANTWGAYYSWNGFDWVTITTAFAFTMTPSEAGLGVQFQTPAAAVQTWNEFHYFRYNAPNE